MGMMAQQSSSSDDDDEDEEEDDDEPPQKQAPTEVEGAYNPDDYADLNVSADVRDLFQYVQCTNQSSQSFFNRGLHAIDARPTRHAAGVSSNFDGRHQVRVHAAQLGPEE